jgi:hypothetical protein
VLIQSLVPRSAVLVRFGLWARRKLMVLADRVVPVSYALFERSVGLSETMMMAVVCEFRIPELLQNGPKSAEELAELTQTDPDVMHRVLRALASRGIFELRDADGLFQHSRLSLGLLKSQPEASRDWAEYFGSTGNLRAWADLRTSLVDGRSAFDRVFGETVWEWFAKNPKAEENFARCMMGVTRIQAAVILSLYDFQNHSLICDVGGGRGTLLAAVLKENLNLRAVLCEAPGVLESASRLFRETGLTERVDLRPGNFFEAVPEGADCYLLKNILHDWSDEVCLKILKSVRKSMSAGHTLLVVEQLLNQSASRLQGLSESNGDSKPELRDENRGRGSHHPLVCFSDIQMLIACSGGRERSASQLCMLLHQAGFEIVRIQSHPIIGLIVARARDGVLRV